MTTRRRSVLADPCVRSAPPERDHRGSSLGPRNAAGYALVIVVAVLMAGCLGAPADGDVSPTRSGAPDAGVQGPGGNGPPPDEATAADPVLDTDRPVSFVGPGLHHVRIDATEDVIVQNVSWEHRTAEVSTGAMWFAWMKLGESLDGATETPCQGPPLGLVIESLNAKAVGSSAGVDRVMEEGAWDVFAYIEEDGRIDFEFNRTSSDEPVVLDRPSRVFNATWHQEIVEGTFPSAPAPFDWDYRHPVQASGPGFAIAAMAVRGSPFVGSDGMTVQVTDEEGQACSSATHEETPVETNNPVTVTTTGTVMTGGDLLVEGSFSADLRSHDGRYGAEVALVTAR